MLADHDQVVYGDVLVPDSLAKALNGIEVAYYLVHSMGAGRRYAERDREGASNFARAAREAGVGKIIYLGGLGSGDSLSKHLESRQEVGRILKEPSRRKPKPATGAAGRVVTAKRQDHVWHIDLTTVSIGSPCQNSSCCRKYARSSWSTELQYADFQEPAVCRQWFMVRHPSAKIAGLRHMGLKNLPGINPSQMSPIG